MRIIRFEHQGQPVHGVESREGHARLLASPPPGDPVLTEREVPIGRLLAPVTPVDILCIGLNYREHAAESGAPIPAHPVLFIKSGNALNHPNAPILIPAVSQQVDYECELAVYIARDARNVSREQALSHVFGYTCANDISARDWQRDATRSGGQWCRAKSFDGFCPIGPALVTADEAPHPNALRIRTLLNDQVMQDHTTADMIFDVPELISRLSRTMTLRAGTLILTGTPQGVGFARKPPVFLRDGDHLVTEIESIGRLENPIAAEAPYAGS